MNVSLNKNRSIGKVLFIVEGAWTEAYVLRRIFTSIFDYQFETILRQKGYKKYNSKENATSADEVFFAFNCIFTYRFLHTVAGITS